MNIAALFLLLGLAEAGENHQSDLSRADAITFCDIDPSESRSEKICRVLVGQDGTEISDEEEIIRIVLKAKEGKSDYKRLPPRPSTKIIRRVRDADFACVAIGFDITEEGRPENIIILRSGTTVPSKRKALPLFEKSVIKAAEGWRYIPIEDGANLYQCKGMISNITFDFG